MFGVQGPAASQKRSNVSTGLLKRLADTSLYQTRVHKTRRPAQQRQLHSFSKLPSLQKLVREVRLTSGIPAYGGIFLQARSLQRRLFTEHASQAMLADHNPMSYHALRTNKCLRNFCGRFPVLQASHGRNIIIFERRRLASVHSIIKCTALNKKWQEVEDPASGRLYFW